MQKTEYVAGGMRTRATVALWIGVVVAVCVVALGFVRFIKEQTPAHVTMRDGTTLYIRGVVAGTNVYTTDTRLTSIARKLLPGSLKQRFLDDPMIFRGGSDPNQISFVFTRNDAKGNKLPTFWEKVETIDGTGFAYLESPGSGTMGNNDLLQLTLTSFPRRDRTFLARLYDNNGALLCQFPVRNPFPETKFATWKAEPFPITKTNGDVRFTLTGLRFEEGWNGFHYYSPRFKIKADDAGLRSGKHMENFLTDATGNSGQFLSTNEPAWKMHVQLYRPDASAFPSNLVWQSPMVDVPGQLSLTNVHWSNVVGGLNISVPVICGPGTLTISNYTNFTMQAPVPTGRTGGWSSWSSIQGRREQRPSHVAFGFVEVGNMEDSTEIILQFRDDRGKLMKIERNGYSSVTDINGKSRRRYAVELTDTNCHRASLEVKVNRAVPFDFMVDPRQISAAKK